MNATGQKKPADLTAKAAGKTGKGAPHTSKDKTHSHYIDISLCLEEFRAFIADQYGVGLQGEIQADGEFHGLGTDQDKKPDAPFRYCVHLDSPQNVYFIDLKRGFDGTWYPENRAPLDPAEREHLRREFEAAKAERDKKTQESQAKAAERARHLWEQAKPADPEHPYLKRKGAGVHGIRQLAEWKRRVYNDAGAYETVTIANVLLVPMRDSAGEICNVQAIFPSASQPLGRDKDFLPKGRKKGLSHVFGSDSEILCLTEGYATAASIHAATGYRVWVCFDCGNLLDVAETVRDLHPDARIVICGDNDGPDKQGRRAGPEKAREAAAAVGGFVALPPVEGMDFNDWAATLADTSENGAIKALIDAAATADAKALAEAGKPDAQGKKPKKEKAAPKNAGIPNGFRLLPNGLFFMEERTDDDGKTKEKLVYICSPIQVIAETRSNDQGQWGRLLEWHDRDGETHRWAVPMAKLEGEPSALCAELADGGLLIGVGAKVRNLLVRYIKDCAPGIKARCVDRVGWHKGVYVLPVQSIGENDGERVLFQNGAAKMGDFRQKGTVKEWRDTVAALCAFNSRPMLGIGFAFAAPLIELAGEESGGAHFRGDSSCGKSTLLHAAASVYGPPAGDHPFRKEWRATGNGLEALAASRNDSLLILDEMGQVDGKEAGVIAYMLANGQPKSRMMDNTGLRKSSTWKLFFLSTGEISLADHMAAAGKKIKAGQEARLADIPADAGAGHGVFDQLNGHRDGAALSIAIREASARHYGAVGLAFIEEVAKRQDSLPAYLKVFADKFIGEVLPANASGQVHRVAKRFALVAAALELAGEWGLTGWQENMGTFAVKACFTDWLSHRGGVGDHEERAILSQVKAFFEAHSESRFSDWHHAEKEDTTENTGRATANRVGFKRRSRGEGFVYYVLPEAFRNEICAGLDANKAAQLMANNGWIEVESGSGRPDKKTRLPGFGNATRCYVFTPEMWG